MSTIPEYWYRYDYDRRSPGVDECDNTIPGTVVLLKLRKFLVEKKTPKGVWLREKFGPFSSSTNRFVLNEAKKQFACPSLEAAEASFRARKKTEIRIYTKRIEIAQASLRLMDRKKEGSSEFVR